METSLVKLHFLFDKRGSCFKADKNNYSILHVAPAAVRASFNLSASSFERSALTTVGQDSTNFLACTKFIPSTRFLISLISVTFFAVSNDSSLTVNEVWKKIGRIIAFCEFSTDPNTVRIRNPDTSRFWMVKTGFFGDRPWWPSGLRHYLKFK